MTTQRRHADVEAIARRLVGADIAGSGSTIDHANAWERKRRVAVVAKGAAVLQAFTSSAPGGSSLVQQLNAAKTAADPFEAARRMAADDRIRRAIDAAAKKRAARS